MAARRFVLVSLAVVAWLVLGAGAYLWYEGKISVGAPPQSKSPFVHWWYFTAKLPLSDCRALTQEVYQSTGPTVVEAHHADSESVGQVGVAGTVTATIVCTLVADQTLVFVAVAGADQALTRNRGERLRDAVRVKLGL